MSGSDARALSRSLLDLCRMRKLTIATAESCTGGLVAGALTDIPGSSDVIDRGFVTYSNDAKRAMLGVKSATLSTLRRGQQGDRDRDGDRRAGARRRRSCRLHHRHCRSGRRDAGQAGRPRASCGRRPRRQNSASRMPLRRNRPQRGAPALRRRGPAHADGTGARTAGAGQAAPRNLQPVASAQGALAAAQRRQKAASRRAPDQLPTPSSSGLRFPVFRKSYPRAFRTLPQIAGTRYRTWFPSASPASGS